MRITYRDKNNKTYWTDRWTDIDSDEPMQNHDKYPLKFSLLTVKEKNKLILEAGCGAGRILRYYHNKGYKIISNGTDNHCLLIDLRNKNVTGKDAENSLGLADITVNKNMVPFDTQSPFVTSGIRVGTAAITTRGVSKEEIKIITNLIDLSINNYQNESELLKIKSQVNELMSSKPLFKW